MRDRTIDECKGMLDLELNRRVRCRYADGILPTGTPRVFCTNHTITDFFPPQYVLPAHKWAIDRRLTWLKVVKDLRLHRPHQPENDEYHHFREKEALIREEYYAPAGRPSLGTASSGRIPGGRNQFEPSSQSSAASDRSHVMLPIRHRSSQKALLALEDRPQQRLAIKNRPQTPPAPIAKAPEACLSSGEQRLLRFVRQFHVQFDRLCLKHNPSVKLARTLYGLQQHWARKHLPPLTDLRVKHRLRSKKPATPAAETMDPDCAFLSSQDAESRSFFTWCHPQTIVGV